MGAWNWRVRGWWSIPWTRCTGTFPFFQLSTEILSNSHRLLKSYFSDIWSTVDFILCYYGFVPLYCISCIGLLLGWYQPLLGLLWHHHFLLVWESELCFVYHCFCWWESCFHSDLPVFEISYVRMCSCNHQTPCFLKDSVFKYVYALVIAWFPLAQWLGVFTGCSYFTWLLLIFGDIFTPDI